MITILPFGQFKDMPITTIPDNYLFWLADRGRSRYYKSRHSLDVTWKPDIKVWEAARAECDRRGVSKCGERWERIR